MVQACAPKPTLPLCLPLPSCLLFPQIRNPNYGSWLDAYFTTLGPLPMPTTGLLGATYKPGTAAAASSASASAAAVGATQGTAALVFTEV